MSNIVSARFLLTRRCLKGKESMVRCAVSDCESRSGPKKPKDLIFHKFPRDPEVAQAWVKLCQNPEPINTAKAVICSLHFNEEDYEHVPIRTRKRKILKIDEDDTDPIERAPSTSKTESKRSQRARKRSRWTTTVESKTESAVRTPQGGNSSNLNGLLRATEQVTEITISDENVNESEETEAAEQIVEITISDENVNESEEKEASEQMAEIAISDENVNESEQMAEITISDENVNESEQMAEIAISDENVNESEETEAAEQMAEITISDENVNESKEMSSNVNGILKEDGIDQLDKDIEQLEKTLERLVEEDIPKEIRDKSELITSEIEIRTNKMRKGLKLLNSDEDKLSKLFEESKQENEMLKSEKERIKNEVDKKRKCMSKCFTPHQIDLLLTEPDEAKKLKWPPDDVARAIIFRSTGSKGYKHVKKIMNLPLPGVKTLKKWADRTTSKPGLLHGVLRLMKEKGNKYKKQSKLVVLSIGEMEISSKICFDCEKEQVYGPFNTCQIIMARSLLGAWKQLIFYDFDTKITKDLLLRAIKKLAKRDYTVVAITSNVDENSVALWNEFNIGTDPEMNCFIENPTDKNKKIFFFADARCTLVELGEKLLGGKLTNIKWEKKFDSAYFDHLAARKNHKLKSTQILNEMEDNFKPEDELKLHSIISTKISHVTTELFQYRKKQENTLFRDYKLDTDDLSLFDYVEMVNRGIFKPKDIRHPSLQMATNLGNIAKELFQYTQLALLPSDAVFLAMFIKTVHNWFEIFNAGSVRVFGEQLNEQILALEAMSGQMSNIRVDSHETLLPFQKGILLSNKSLQELYEYLKGQYGNSPKFELKRLPASRLTLELLDNFFSLIRKMGPNQHPAALDMKLRIQSYLFGKNPSEPFTELDKVNYKEEGSEEDASKCMTQSMLRSLPDEPIPQTADHYEQAFPEDPFVESGMSLDEIRRKDEYSDLLRDVNYSIKKGMEPFKFHDATYDLREFVATHFFEKYPELSIPKTAHLTCYSNLPYWAKEMIKCDVYFKEPTDNFHSMCLFAENKFKHVHGEEMSKEPGILKKVASLVKESLPKELQFPEEVLAYMVRLQTYLRLGALNNTISGNRIIQKYKDEDEYDYYKQKQKKDEAEENEEDSDY